MKLPNRFKNLIFRKGNEKGSVTLFVLIAMLFFLMIGMMIFIINMNAETAQKRDIEKIQNDYNANTSETDLEQMYQEAKAKQLGTFLIKIMDQNGEIYNSGDWINSSWVEGGRTPLKVVPEFPAGISETNDINITVTDTTNGNASVDINKLGDIQNMQIGTASDGQFTITNRVDPNNTININIDKTPPTVAKPTGSTVWRGTDDEIVPGVFAGTTITLIPSDNLSGVKEVQYILNSSADAPADDAEWTTYNDSTGITINNEFELGTYYIHTRAIDVAGNVGNVVTSEPYYVRQANYKVTTTSGTKYAEFLNEAGAIEGATEIKVIRTFTDNETATLNQNVTIDTNGKTLTMGDTITVASGKTVTFVDTATTKGKLQRVVADGEVGNLITNNGTVNVGTNSTDGAKLESKDFVTQGGTVTVNSGNINCLGKSGCTDSAGIYSYIIDVNGGNITNNDGNYGIICSSGTCNISGGTIFAKHAICPSAGTLTISGSAYIEGSVSGVRSSASTHKYTLNMTGGTIKATGGYAITSSTEVNVTITGGLVISDTHDAIYLTSANSTLTIGDNSNALNREAPEITGGGSGYSVNIASGSTFNYYDGKLIGAKHDKKCYGRDVTFNYVSPDPEHEVAGTTLNFLTETEGNATRRYLPYTREISENNVTKYETVLEKEVKVTFDKNAEDATCTETERKVLTNVEYRELAGDDVNAESVTYANLPKQNPENENDSKIDRTGYTFKGWNGKNKFDESKYTNLETFTRANEYYFGAPIQLKPNTTYKVSIKRYNNFNGNVGDYRFLLIGDNSNINHNWSAIAHPTGTSLVDYLYTTGGDGLLYIGYTGLTQEQLDTIWANTDVQIEEGTTATAYEPYFVTDDTLVTQDTDHTLTAIWEAKTYNITYNLDGGTNNENNPSTYTVESPDITLQDPTKEGYIFRGWTGNGTDTPTKNLVLPHGSTEDKTFTANWGQIHYNVTVGETTTPAETLAEAVSIAEAGIDGTTVTTATITALMDYTDNSSTEVITEIDSETNQEIEKTIVKINKNIAFDLAGHTITRGATITNNGTLDIYSSVDGGTLTGAVDTLITNNGTLTTNGTSADHTLSLISNEGRGITIQEGAVNGRIIINNKTTVTARDFTLYNNGSTKAGNTPAIEINGAETRITSIDSRTIQNEYAGDILINNGIISSNVSSTILNYGEGTVTVKNGTITSTANCVIYNTTTGTINVEGGTISGTAGIYNEANGTINVSGASTSITASASSGIGIRGRSGTVNVQDGNIFGKYGGVYVEKQGNIAGVATITGGTITSDTYGLGTNGNATINLEGGSVTGSDGIYNAANGIINVSGKNTSITSTGASGYGIRGYVGTVNIQGGNITAKFGGVFVQTKNNVSGSATITGGTITSEKYSVGATGTATITLGTNDGTVSKNSPEIISTATSGDFYSVYKDSTTTFNFYDGKIVAKDKWSIDTDNVNTPDGYQVVKRTADGKETAVLEKEVTVTFEPNPGETTGGTVSEETRKVLTNVEYQYDATAGENRTLPTPTKIGYTFNGWHGKNLFNPDNLIEGKNIIKNEDGSVGAVNKTSDGSAWTYQNSNMHLTLPAGTYTLSFNMKKVASSPYAPYVACYVIKDDDSLINITYFSDKQFEKATFTLEEPTDIGIKMKLYDAEAFIQLEQGSTATAYEPYYVTDTTLVARDSDHTLYADWEANPYTVHFNSNGGTGTMADQDFTYDVSQALTTNAFTKTGYTFAGWSQANEGFNSNLLYSNDEEKTNTSGTNEEFMQYVDLAPYFDQYGTNARYRLEYDIKSEDTTNRNTMWVYFQNGSTTRYSFKRNDSQENNVDYLYRHIPTVSSTEWTHDTLDFEIFRNNNNETNAMLAFYGGEYGNGNVPIVKNVRLYIIPDYTNGQTVSNLTAENNATVNLYAVWTANNYTVTADAMGGTVTSAEGWDTTGAQPTKTVTYDSAYGTLPTVTRTGYTFEGWHGRNILDLSKYAGDRTYFKVDNEKIRIIKTDDNVDYQTRMYHSLEHGKNYTISANITGDFSNRIYAFFGKDLYANNVNNNRIEQTFIFSSTNDKGPLRIFQGTGTNISIVLNTDEVEISNIMLVEGDTAAPYEPYWITDDTKVVQDQDHTLTAIWEANPYTVHFDKNDSQERPAVGEVADQEFTYGQAQNLNANEFVRIGYTFTGWNTAADGTGTPFTDGQSVSNLVATANGNITLYAQWIEANATFIVGGGFSATIKKLAGNLDAIRTTEDNTITQIKYATIGSGADQITLDKLKEIKSQAVASDATITSETKYVKVSVDALSNTPIYVWAVDDVENAGKKIIYWFSEDDTPSLNEDARYMFYKLQSVTTIPETNKFNTDNTTQMNYMFYKDVALTSLDTSGFNTSKVTGFEYMFYYCSSLTTLKINRPTTGVSATMKGMFYGCSGLTSYNESTSTGLDLRGFNTNNVTVMEQMFMNCSALQSLDLSGFDTSSVQNMENMFQGCSSLTSLNISNFDTSEVTTMRAMFSGCSSLTQLDLRSFATNKVQSMWKMFNNCSNLTTIYATNSFVTTALTNQPIGGNYDETNTTSSHLFHGCTSLIGGSGTAYSIDHKDADYAWIDGRLDNNSVAQPGYFTNHYYVEFDKNANDATGTMSRQAVPLSCATNLTLNAFEKQDYVFLGWNTEPDGSGQSFSDGESIFDITSELGGTVTLYARWTKFRLTPSQIYLNNTTNNSALIAPNGTAGAKVTYNGVDVGELTFECEDTNIVTVTSSSTTQATITVAAGAQNGDIAIIKVKDRTTGELLAELKVIIDLMPPSWTVRLLQIY